MLRAQCGRLVLPSSEEHTDENSHVQSNPESDHPFEQNLFGLNLEDVAVDPVETLVVIRDRLRGFARLVLRRAGREERVVDLGDHGGHGPSFLIGA